MTFPVALVADVRVINSRSPRELVKTFLRTAPHETDKSCDNTILGLRWHTLETRCGQCLCIDFATEGANDAQFNGSNRNCFHGGICLVAHCARTFPSKHRNVNQSDRYDDELQRLASD